MRLTLGVVVGTIGIVLCCACRSASARQPSAAPPTSQTALSTQEGLRTMRMVLSAELNDPLLGRQGFGNLSDVLRRVPSVQAEATLINSETASLGDYNLRITRSEDQRHFQASLTPATGCASSWFGGESSIIYTGRALGCPSQ